MTKFVLVPGGWHGAWVYDEVAAGLRRAGHESLAVTLTGLGQDDPIGDGSTNLQTHIRDVTRLLESEGIVDCVLCGHSYGGMVIAGVADRVPSRVAGMVFIDAYVPEDGDSCWSLTTDYFRRLFIERASSNGFSVEPPSNLDPRTRAHPLASFVQALRLGVGFERVPRKAFIYLAGWRGTPFASTQARLRCESGWRVHTMNAGHNVMAEAPEQLVQILASDWAARGGRGDQTQQ